MLFVGDDWAEDRHDIEVVNEQVVGSRGGGYPRVWMAITRLHALIAAAMPPRWAELEPGQAAARVKVGIETDRGLWVASLVAAGHEVFAINPMSASRYRERHAYVRS